MSLEELKNITREQELLFNLTVAAFEKIPDAVVVADVEGNIRLVNGRTEEFFGYHRSELIGKKVEELLPEQLREVHVQHRKSFWKDPHTRWMGQGRPLTAVTKDGDEFEVYIMLAPLIIAQGRFMITVLRKS